MLCVLPLPPLGVLTGAVAREGESAGADDPEAPRRGGSISAGVLAFPFPLLCDRRAEIPALAESCFCPGFLFGF